MNLWYVRAILPLPDKGEGCYRTERRFLVKADTWQVARDKVARAQEGAVSHDNGEPLFPTECEIDVQIVEFIDGPGVCCLD
jgi:hypothetical protein